MGKKSVKAEKHIALNISLTFETMPSDENLKKLFYGIRKEIIDTYREQTPKGEKNPTIFTRIWDDKK